MQDEFELGKVLFLPETPAGKLPADTLAEAAAKAHAILAEWRESTTYRRYWDELDACFAVAQQHIRWGVGLGWRQLVAVVKDQPIPLE